MKRTPFIHIVILIAFIFNSFGYIPISQAQVIRLPEPGMMVQLSPEYNPIILKGITVHPENPFKFEFILDKGDSINQRQQGDIKQESTKLVKYFLSSITTPENDLWVNLSPYEKNKIIPESFGQTDMGRDLLAEDYILKQVTASLIYPEGAIGKQFWKRVYELAAKRYGTTNIPVNTFNKVWIVPDHAKVYEHGNTAFVIKATLKVMLEEDYLSMSKHVIKNNVNALGSQVVREIVIPELTQEVNEGKNFATLRQVYNSLILAVWFKKSMKDTILGRKYMDQNKVLNLSSPKTSVGDPAMIYQRYLKAFKKGVFNYIKQEAVIDPESKEQGIIPRKYFSGGAEFEWATTRTEFSRAMTIPERVQVYSRNYTGLTVNLANSALTMNAAMPATQAMRNVGTLNQWLRHFRFSEENKDATGLEDFSIELKSTELPSFDIIAPDFNLPPEKKENRFFVVQFPINGNPVVNNEAFRRLSSYIGKMIGPKVVENQRTTFNQFIAELDQQVNLIRFGNKTAISSHAMTVKEALDQLNNFPKEFKFSQIGHFGDEKEGIKFISNNRSEGYTFVEPSQNRQGKFLIGIPFKFNQPYTAGYFSLLINGIESFMDYSFDPRDKNEMDEFLEYVKQRIKQLDEEQSATEANSAMNAKGSVDQLELKMTKRPFNGWMINNAVKFSELMIKKNAFKFGSRVKIDFPTNVTFNTFFNPVVHRKSTNGNFPEWWDMFSTGINHLIQNSLEGRNNNGAKEVNVTMKIQSDHLIVVIKDNGPGIAYNLLRNLNDRITNKRTVTTKSEEFVQGQGVMTVLEEFMGDMGAGIVIKNRRIETNSKGYTGTTITISFPIIPEKGLNFQLTGVRSPDHVRTLNALIRKQIKLENKLNEATKQKKIERIKKKLDKIETKKIHLATRLHYHREFFPNLISNPDHAMLNQGPGGIDLTAKRMIIDVDSDKSSTTAPLNLKALENIEIDGLYIKDIEIKPLKNLPQLLGVAAN